jgi:ppGpp synthetase/RelA/SpoT-type nucleotidyltranferase
MLLNIEQIKKEYDERQAKLNFLIEEIKFSLLQELSRNKIKIHSLIHRIKSLDSFLGKIRNKDVKEPFNEIHDLAGVRVICLFLPDLQQIGSIIQNQFDGSRKTIRLMVVTRIYLDTCPYIIRQN